MLKYLLLCRSLTYAQCGARVLERSGITAIITKAPKAASGSGCGYCVKVSESKLSRAIRELNEAGLSPLKILVRQEDGSFNEVGS